MAGRAPSQKSFAQILEDGEKVDSIFKDSPPPRGTDPYDMLKSGNKTQLQTEGAEEPESPDSIQPLCVEVVEKSGSPARSRPVTPATAPKVEAAPAGWVDPPIPNLDKLPGRASIEVASEPEPVAPKAEPVEHEKLVVESPLPVADGDSFYLVNRKLAVVEALFKLVAREYYTFGQLISEILRIGMDAVKSESGSFIEIDYVEQHMFFRAVTGRHSANLLNFTIPVGQGVAGFVCETQQPMALSNIDESSVYLRSISTAVGFEAKNMVAYPVVIRGVTFGCIELLNRLGQAQYSEEDREVLTAYTECAARVIENRLIMAALSREAPGATAAATAKKPGEDAA